MQKRLWLGALLIGFPSACLFGGGCSSSSSDGSTPTPDAAQDVTQTDTATADVVQIIDAARCDDANIGDLSLPDASLGDSGASIGTCLSCTKASCSTQVTACNASCQCKNDIDDALGCVAAKGGLNASCIGGLLSGGDPSATNLGQCIVAACKTECGLGGFTLPDGSTDAGDQ